MIEILLPSIFSLIFVALFLLIAWCMGRQILMMCRGRAAARDATPISKEESDQIINSLQGTWDVIATPPDLTDGCSWGHAGAVQYERVIVTGGIMAVQAARRGVHSRQIRLARDQDGILYLDNWGTKVVTLTPEQGYVETEVHGYKAQWRRSGVVVPSGGIVVPTGGAVRPGGNDVMQVQGRGIADEIQRLSDLKERGVLSDQEFAEAKQKVLDPGGPPVNQGPWVPPTNQPPPPYPGIGDPAEELLKEKH